MYEYELISRTVIDGDAERVIQLTDKALKQGFIAEDLLEEGLIKGMNSVAEKFRHRKIMIPEVLMSTRAMHAGMITLDPYLSRANKLLNLKILIGTVAGDLHDIGKNLVKMVLASMGANMIDLGIDTSVKKFVQAVRKEKPDYLLMSALLTTTMPVMSEVIEELEKRNLLAGMKVVVGGGPVNEVFAKEIGADLYFADPFSAREYFKNKYEPR